MRRFFLIATGVFLFGTSVPGVARQESKKSANATFAGDDKYISSREKLAPEPDSISSSEHPGSEEWKTGAARLTPQEKATTEESCKLPHKAFEEPEPNLLNPGENIQKKEEAPYSVSFNFLYYLFCKINFSEITKAPAQ